MSDIKYTNMGWGRKVDRDRDRDRNIAYNVGVLIYSNMGREWEMC